LVRQNFGSTPFELNLVLLLGLPKYVKLQSWSDLCQLDEVDLRPRLMKILIILRPDPLSPVFGNFIKLSLPAQLGKNSSRLTWADPAPVAQVLLT